jgi:hypothetical protein
MIILPAGQARVHSEYLERKDFEVYKAVVAKPVIIKKRRFSHRLLVYGCHRGAI